MTSLHPIPANQQQHHMLIKQFTNLYTTFSVQLCHVKTKIQLGMNKIWHALFLFHMFKVLSLSLCVVLCDCACPYFSNCFVCEDFHTKTMPSLSGVHTIMGQWFIPVGWHWWSNQQEWILLNVLANHPLALKILNILQKPKQFFFI